MFINKTEIQNMCVPHVLSFLSSTIKICAMIFVWENAYSLFAYMYRAEKKGHHNGNTGYLKGEL